MSDISLPYRPRPDEDPRAASVVQANLEYLISLFQKGVNQGDIMQWDPVLGRYVAGSAVDATPIGAGKVWFTDTAPAKWLILDGANISRTTYADLFALWSTSFGAGDGSTTFGIPDCRGRMLVGKGTHADVDTLGESDGAALADRRPAHKHTVNDPGHAHTLNTGDSGNQGQLGQYNTLDPSQVFTSNNTTGITIGPQAAGTPTDEPSYIVVNWIVFVGV